MPPAAANAFAPFPIAGVDEVGRGPLAGPVVAAAVVLDPRRPVDGLDDSKRLDAATRERLDERIRRRAAAWCVASASVAEIDELNILGASLLAMRRAVAGLTGTVLAGERGAGGRAAAAADERGGAGPADPAAGRAGVAPALVLVDGNRLPELPYPACAVIGGDARVRAIAAASIVAKVARDAVMRAWHEHHPAFGFARHKGYATKEHREALVRCGATPLHRASFAPVRAALAAAGAPSGSVAGASAPGGAARPAAGRTPVATDRRSTQTRSRNRA